MLIQFMYKANVATIKIIFNFDHIYNLMACEHTNTQECCTNLVLIRPYTTG